MDLPELYQSKRVEGDVRALAGEVCCKELIDRRWHPDCEQIPTCNSPASEVITCEAGVRLPFCDLHW